jgi:hypothetical protein
LILEDRRVSISLYKGKIDHENIRSVSGLQILVEAVALGNELLLPLAEALLLDLDLLGETLAQVLFLLLELGVVQLARTGLAELAGLHLLGTVGLVVRFLGGVDEVKHVGADQDGAELLEVTVVLVLDLRNTPGVLTTLDDTAIVGLDILLGTNNSEGHGSHQAAGVGSGVLVILLHGWGVNLDALGLDDTANLGRELVRFDFICDLVSLLPSTYSLLVAEQVGVAQGIGLSDNGNQVDTRAQALHDLNVERLKGVPSRTDEVQTGVHTHINLIRTAGLLLLEHVRLVLVIQEFDNGLPGVTVVDIVAESGGINNGQTD